MSIDYYGVPVRKESLIGDFIEGRDTGHLVDVAKVRAALETSLVSGGETGQYKWESGADYVFVDVSSSVVHVSHNAGGRSSYQMEVMMDVLDALQRAGLHVYDPQQGKWFPATTAS